MGAYEHPEPAIWPNDLSDTQGEPDGMLDVDDLLVIIGAWSELGGLGDVAPAPCGMM
jgi:hypothetical protein